MKTSAVECARGRTRVVLDELLALRGVAGKLRALRSQARRSGGEASRSFGRGMDYAESRAYQAGDDVRRLDWRLTARSGRLHTKLFQEEREAQLLIVLDLHSSMRFGTRERYKSVQAARAAALAAWLAVRAGERVGLLGFGRGSPWLRPQGGVRGATAVCGALAAWDEQCPASGDSPPVTLSEALGKAVRSVRNAQRLLLISDGWHGDTAAERRLHALAPQGRVALLAVADALELYPLPSGRYPLAVDGQRGEAVLTKAADSEALQQQLAAGHRRMQQWAQTRGLASQVIDTMVDPGPVIQALLGARGASR